MINIAINGFGRIGRAIARYALQDKHFNIVALNDIHQWDILSYLFSCDSTHGRLCAPFESKNHTLFFPPSFNPSPIALLNAKDKPDFSPFKADIVFESSGHFLDSQSVKYHLQNGVKNVILTAPPLDDTPMFVLGVNEKDYKNEQIISNASCTANAIAPLCKILHNAFEIKHISIGITHSYTNEQSLLDSVYIDDKRRSRAAAQNIIPTHTGAIKALSMLIPELKGRILGHSVRVPVANMLLLDMSIIFAKAVSVKQINDFIKQKSRGEFQGIIGIDENSGVSSDFIGSTHSAVFVPDLSAVAGAMCKIMAWCDNESSYAQRSLDLARFITK